MDGGEVLRFLGLASPVPTSSASHSSPKMARFASHPFSVGQVDVSENQAAAKLGVRPWHPQANRPDAINERDGSSSSGSFSEDSIIDEGFHSGSLPSSQELIQPFDQGRQVKDGKKARRKSKDCPPQTHVHLGGVRHCRIPLDPEIREVLEVAWASRIIQPGVDGRKEKERIAEATGLTYAKVHEWFRNRRKKAKLIGLRKKGLAPTPPKKRTPFTRQQSGSSSSSDLSLKFEATCIEQGTSVASGGTPTTDMLSVD